MSVRGQIPAVIQRPCVSSVNPMAVLMRIAVAVLRSTEGMGCRREKEDVPNVTAL